MLSRIARLTVTVLLATLVVAGVAWSALALWFDGPASRLLAVSMAAGMALLSIILAVRVRLFLKGLIVALLPVIAVVLWWASISPSNTRDWSPDVARPALAVFRGSSVTIAPGFGWRCRVARYWEGCARWES